MDARSYLGIVTFSTGPSVELARLIARTFRESCETYGAPHIQAELVDDHGWGVGRVAGLVRELALADVSRRHKGVKTTVRAKEAPAAADLVRRQFRASGPDRRVSPSARRWSRPASCRAGPPR
jgi:hypothetical protein